MSIVKRFFLFLAGRLGNNYESEHTRFMREYMAKHPEEFESQRQGRAAWWDKTRADMSPAPSMRHAPRSGGAEHMFAPDDNTNQSIKKT